MNCNSKKGNIREINELLEKGENIISLLTSNHSEQTSPEDEMISYDLRAGTDIERFRKDSKYFDDVANKIVTYLDCIGCCSGSIIECGSGEGINLLNICSNRRCSFSWARGIDISWSRTAYAKLLLGEFEKINLDIDFIVGDFFHLPIKDNSVDCVYTMQGIYGMGGCEEILLEELYRVTKKYLILIEPCYELANDEAKKRMTSLGYVKGLKDIAEKHKYKIAKYELFGIDANPLNPAAVMIIEKSYKSNNKLTPSLCCPYTHGELLKIGNALFCDESKLSYPILNEIACLTRENAIITSKIQMCDYMKWSKTNP